MGCGIWFHSATSVEKVKAERKVQLQAGSFLSFFVIKNKVLQEASRLTLHLFFTHEVFRGMKGLIWDLDNLTYWCSSVDNPVQRWKTLLLHVPIFPLHILSSTTKFLSTTTIILLKIKLYLCLLLSSTSKQFTFYEGFLTQFLLKTQSSFAETTPMKQGVILLPCTMETWNDLFVFSF